MKRFASDLLCVWAGAGGVVGREKHQAVQEQRHLRVWEKKRKESTFKGKRQAQPKTRASAEK